MKKCLNDKIWIIWQFVSITVVNDEWNNVTFRQKKLLKSSLVNAAAHAISGRA